MAGRVNTFQANFTVGELSPRMLGRADIEQYYKGLRHAENVIGTPQGGMRKRPGLKFIDAIAGVTDFEKVQLAPFVYDFQNKYLLVFKPLEIDIYKDGVLSDNLASPYDEDQIPKLRYSQDLSSMVIVDGTIAPQRLVLDSVGGTWSIGNLNFKNYPTYDFNKNYSSITFTLGATTGTSITLTASAPIFTTENVGGTFVTIPGVAKIVAYTDSTHVTVNIVIPFSEATVPGSQAILTEPAFSDTRGWPACVTFYQSRLAFAATSSLPNGLFISVLNDYENFLVGLGLATDALILLLAGAEVGSIQYLLDASSLFVFTTAGNWATPPSSDQALTPTTARINKFTATGISANVPPMFIDNQVIYTQKGGKDVLSVKYNIQTYNYGDNSIAYTADHLIRNPLDCTTLEHSSQTQGSYCLFCMDNGQLVIYQTIEEQKIHCWTPSTTTNGSFRRITAVGEEIYCVVEREINGLTKLYIEKVDFDFMVDSGFSAVYMTPQTVITGLDHLEGEFVDVKADGGYIGQKQVIDGQFTLSTAATTVEAGYAFYPRVVPMPINIETPQGNNLYIEKNIKHIYLQFYETLSLVVNDAPVKETILNSYILGDNISPKTGIVELPITASWDPFYQNVITQDAPFSFELLGMTYQVEIT